ncbi:hypothetical protein NH44784_016591 [Achromobacter xylosoxidans NH44784-1996]|nr:hypothetical protein NH44784_016591 [Achromobacter xylosoxidans NH44784-1996]
MRGLHGAVSLRGKPGKGGTESLGAPAVTDQRRMGRIAARVARAAANPGGGGGWRPRWRGLRPRQGQRGGHRCRCAKVACVGGAPSPCLRRAAARRRLPGYPIP